MSKRVFQAAHELGPSSFAGFLRDWLRLRRAPERPVGAKPYGGRPPFEQAFSSLGLGGYKGIVFYDKRNPANEIKFSIRVPGVETRKKGMHKPFLEIQGIWLPLEWSDLLEAAAKTGLPDLPKRPQSDIAIPFPKKLLEHWDENLPEPARAQGLVRIGVQTNQFRKLNSQVSAERFLRRYLETVRYLAGKHNEVSYAKELVWENKKKYEQTLTNYQLFHRHSAQHSRLMIKLAEAKRSELPGLIKSHFKATDAFAQEYAEKIRKELGKGELEGSAAITLAEHAGLKEHEIPANPRRG